MFRLSYRSRSTNRNVSLPNWAIGLMAAGSAAVGIAVFLLISTLAVLLLPIVLVVGGVTAFIMRKRIERLVKTGGFPMPGAQPDDAAVQAARRRAERRVKPDIEDADYRVVDDPGRKP